MGKGKNKKRPTKKIEREREGKKESVENTISLAKKKET